jgi:DNA-binding TFAR19-related protein (PDSD5 family)
MTMDELDALRLRKLQARQRALGQQPSEEEVLARQVEQLEGAARAALTREALARYGNIKASHPEKAVQLLAVIAQLISRGVTSIDDAMLRELLVRLEPPRRETRIKVVRKGD